MSEQRSGHDVGPTSPDTAEQVRARRLELGWTQHHLATEAGISVATIRKLEGAQQDSYRALTLRALCRALGWEPNMLDHLAASPAGGRPSQRSAPTTLPDNSRQDLIAAFNGEIAGLGDDQLTEVLEFVRALRTRHPT
jgi:transcriptional regulator with XRE-family HTH domain